MSAFITGARETNPKAEFSIRFINRGFDSPKAKEAAFAMKIKLRRHIRRVAELRRALSPDATHPGVHAHFAMIDKRSKSNGQEHDLSLV